MASDPSTSLVKIAKNRKVVTKIRISNSSGIYTPKGNHTPDNNYPKKFLKGKEIGEVVHFSN